MRKTLSIATMVALAIAAVVMPKATAAQQPYAPPTCVLATPTAKKPARTCTWKGVPLNSPRAESQVAGPDLTTACSPTTLGDCEDTKVTVPAGLAASSLYVKVAWQHPVWSVFMYVIDPAGNLHGGGPLGCDTASYEKGCGNQTTLAFDELVIADPMPGTWTVRVAAVNIKNEPYVGTIALTNSHPLEYARESLAQLASHLTRHEPVNIVFAGWQPTADELAEIQNGLTTEIVPAVAQKQSGDCNGGADDPSSGLNQHAKCHYTATADPSSSDYLPDGNVPYFEPARFLFDYHFLAADDVWTKDLFAAMKAATTQDHTLSDGRVPATAETGPFKSAYLAAYNAQYGSDRGPDAQVSDTSKVDEIDGVSVEDWVQNHRFDKKYANSFTDLVTGTTRSASFINPDPNATRDPFWDSNGTKAPNLDKDPQGVNSGVTFFLLDTFTPSYAGDYFRMDHYHYWWTADHVVDPDGNEPGAFTDNGRGWGGRYRFHMLDLGAAPSTYERANWLTASVSPENGSNAFDPPIWSYRNNPQWDGSQDPGPLQAGGNTIGQVMGWEITQGLSFKYVGGLLYRPIPNDVYVAAFNNMVDHYSLPSEGDFYSVDMDKVAQNEAALHALSSSAPYATFQLGPAQTRTLGCAANRAVIIGNPTQVGTLTQGLVQQVPDPKCAGQTPDGLQQAIEDGKANGSGALVDTGDNQVPTFAVNMDYMREYIDAHRADFAPLYDGAFTLPVINIMFEHTYTVALPLVVGGIAEGAVGGEGWGQIDNVNDQYVLGDAINCAQSSPIAPGCNGIPDIFRHDVGLTYTMIHESAHFLGLNHPHDGEVAVEKSADGQWHYYYEMLKWLYDISASPTTYAGSYSTYEIVDQERLMVGHAAEYLKQAQDALSDAYFMDGASGRTSPSKDTAKREAAAKASIDQASKLFTDGDYLHAMYAMRNAALQAKGVTGKAVAPHKMSLAEAAANKNAIFKINPQKVYAAWTASPDTPPQWVGPEPATATARAQQVQPAAAAVAAAGPTYRAGVGNFCHIHW